MTTPPEPAGAPTTFLREAESAGDTDRWTRAFWVLWTVVFAIRVVYAAVFPLGLAPDESYYWDWGRRLDIGYYSKPPMIGWLMGLAGWLGNDSMFVLKLFPGLMVAAAVLVVFRLGRDLYGARAGFWAAVLLVASPANAALSIFFTIDPPLFLFWSASLWFAWRWLASRGGEARWWWALVLSLGLGALSKQIHLLFGLLLLAYLTVVPRARWRGAFPRLLLALGLSLIFLAPPLLWNWRHDWITFRHTASEIDHPAFGWGRSFKFLGEFLGGQAGLGGGLTWVLMVGTAFSVAWRWRRVPERTRFLWLFFVPGVAAFTLFSLTQRVEQNWPLIFYVAGIVLTAGELTNLGRERRWPNLSLGIAAGLGAALGGALMLVPFVVPKTALAGTRSDPTARLRGWDELAKAVEGFRQQLPRKAETFILAAEDRYVASALAYYLPDRPRTYVWEEPGRPESQYGIWGRPLDRVGEDGLVVAGMKGGGPSEDISRRFSDWRELGQVVVPLGGESSRDRRYRIFLGTKLLGTPPVSSSPRTNP